MYKNLHTSLKPSAEAARFLDYDNDGWMDILMVCGTRLAGAPAGTTNRLYKNNRDGTFIDVTEKAGLHHVGWGNGSVSATTTMTATTIYFAAYFWTEPAVSK